MTTQSLPIPLHALAIAAGDATNAAPHGDANAPQGDAGTDLTPAIVRGIEEVTRTNERYIGLGDWIAIFFLIAGAAFCTLAAVGLCRMPDLYTRMQAAAKAGTAGVSCLVLASAAHFAFRPGGITVSVEVALIMVFIFLSTPAAAHLIARAGYVTRVPLWERTAHDEMADRDDQDPDDDTLPHPPSPDAETTPANPIDDQQHDAVRAPA